MSTSSQCPQGVSADTPQSVFAPCDIPPTRSSCHSVDAYPITTIKGTAYPTTAETTIVHNQPVLPSHVKVMVDEVVIGAEDCLLPVPVLQYTTLNDVVGTYTQWPIHLVLLDEANVKIRSPRQNKPIKDPSVDLSAAGTRRLGLIRCRPLPKSHHIVVSVRLSSLSSVHLPPDLHRPQQQPLRWNEILATEEVLKVQGWLKTRHIIVWLLSPCNPLLAQLSGYKSSPTHHWSAMLFNRTNNSFSSAGTRMPTAPQLASQSLWSGPPGVDIGPAVADPFLSGLKRPSSEVGQTESWFSSNPLAKRPRFETACNLPIYPQRPGEKDCSHYMLTRTCKFGDSCKFDHPIWVPEGGIPDWKEVLITSESLPVRSGEPDCPYYLKTQKCKYGIRCKFNHPKVKDAFENTDVLVLPERPSEPLCAFYMKTGTCKFGATCKFHHPRDIQIQASAQENFSAAETGLIGNSEMIGDVKQTVSPAMLHNSKGLPIRPFYMKTGECKFGERCRFHHPLDHSSPVTSSMEGQQQNFKLSLAGLPRREGAIHCPYYMKTGICKYGATCKFDHPPPGELIGVTSQQRI
nr:zinc finger CCCH domain-containing protein 37-like [Ipomoea trifida]